MGTTYFAACREVVDCLSLAGIKIVLEEENEKKNYFFSHGDHADCRDNRAGFRRRR
jgi:hypothetical protein